METTTRTKTRKQVEGTHVFLLGLDLAQLFARARHCRSTGAAMYGNAR